MEQHADVDYRAEAVPSSELVPVSKELGLIFPSPNWFFPRILVVSPDGLIIYGALTRGICILQPRNENYKIHVLNNTHTDRVNCVTLSDDWSTADRRFLTSSVDGIVKQWRLQVDSEDLKMVPINAHNVHKLEKEEIVSVFYCGDSAVSVGSTGVLVKWDLSANVTRVYKKLLKTFKPTSAAKCPHNPMTVAIGTRQGVLFVMDFSSKAQTLYKVKGHDDEITALSWCPQEEVSIKKASKFTANTRMEAIRNSAVANQKNEKRKETVKPKKDESICDDNTELDESENNYSFVPNDDTFDIYVDHEHEEFGHKKYVPEEIFVPIEKKQEQNDFLAECLKLKKDIMDNKNKQEQSIHSLVESLKKTEISKQSQVKIADEIHNDQNGEQASACSSSASINNSEQNENKTIDNESTKDISSVIATDININIEDHKNLLFTLDKVGKCCLWSKTGKLINRTTSRSKQMHHNSKSSTTNGALLWYRPDVLITSDGKNVIEYNPLVIDSANKMEFKTVHSAHKRGPYCIASAAPSVQTADDKTDCLIWSVSQDRNMIAYSYSERKVERTFATVGGHVYHISVCPYDASRLAIACGDGNIRIMELSGDVSSPLLSVTCYWQNLQGRITITAAHPSRDNLLAFATAEGRVGIMDTRPNKEKPARLIGAPLRRSVYSLSWSSDGILFVCSVGELYTYDSNKSNSELVPIEITFEGKRWSPTDATWTERGLCIGTKDGEVAVATNKPPYTILSAAFCLQKIVQCIVWHPQNVTTSDEESDYKNLIAAAANQNKFVVLRLKEQDGTFTLEELASISRGKYSVVRLTWSPHRNGHILSTSQDSTVIIWKVTLEGETSCLSIFDGHVMCSLCAEWWPGPECPDLVLSGSMDQSLRLWDSTRYPPELASDKTASKSGQFVMASPENECKKEKKDKERPSESNDRDDEETEQIDEGHNGAMAVSCTMKKPGKQELFAISKKQAKANGLKACRLLLRQGKEGFEVNEGGTDFVKIFGSMDEFNELLDLEQNNLLSRERLELWATLGIMRGRIESVFQTAAARHALSPFLLSVAPMVSHRFWKDQMQAYMAQLERQVSDQTKKNQTPANKFRIRERRQAGGVPQTGAAAEPAQRHRLRRLPAAARHAPRGVRARARAAHGRARRRPPRQVGSLLPPCGQLRAHGHHLHSPRKTCGSFYGPE